jgi:hypothetical protein
MGYNTTVVVMNDALGMIEQDAGFGKRLADAISMAHGGKMIDVPAYSANGRGVHCNAATVIETHHADYDVLVRVGHNCGEVVPYTRARLNKAIDRAKVKE